jgi:hypothetical protein
MASSLPQDEFNAFMRELNSIDISNLDDWDKLRENLEATGNTTVLTSSAFREFEE